MVWTQRVFFKALAKAAAIETEFIQTAKYVERAEVEIEQYKQQQPLFEKDPKLAIHSLENTIDTSLRCLVSSIACALPAFLQSVAG